MTGRWWAYAGAVLGGAVSVAANVAHSYVPPDGAADGWTPHAGSVIGAVFWPVALLTALEIMARVDWPDGRRWTAVRYIGLLPVAVVAAVVSYRHMSGLLGFYREDPLTARIGPLAVDGLMVMAAGALLAYAGRADGTAGQDRGDTQDRTDRPDDGSLRSMHAPPREGQGDRLRRDVGVRRHPALSGPDAEPDATPDERADADAPDGQRTVRVDKEARQVVAQALGITEEAARKRIERGGLDVVDRARAALNGGRT